MFFANLDATRHFGEIELDLLVGYALRSYRYNATWTRIVKNAQFVTDVFTNLIRPVPRGPRSPVVAVETLLLGFRPNVYRTHC